jgi:hypothetical protein
MAARVQITEDHVAKAVGGLHALMGKEVLVGIPEAGGRRADAPINNAEIGYIQEFGSPANNIPPRPFLIPGVEKATPKALERLKVATQRALDGDKAGAERAMYQAGALAMISAKAEISSNIPPPLKPGTIRGRKYSRGTKSRRPEEDYYADLLNDGMSAADAQSTAGINSLVNTGSLRNSITYLLGNKAK